MSIPRRTDGPAPGATAVDVARRAGVSRATVSHVLNGQVAKFAPETVEKVRRAAAELGYVRSAVGRALAVGRTDIVVLALADFAVDPGYRANIEATAARLEDLGFMSVIHVRLSAGEHSVSARLHHLVATLRPAGVVDLGGLSARDVVLLGEAGCPVVPSGRRPEANGNNVIGRRQAEHLCARGYERIVYAFPTGVSTDAFGETRFAAGAEVCARLGLPAPEVVEVAAGPAAATTALRRIARPGLRVGVAVYEEVLAEALVAAAGPAGVSVPGSVGVVGVRDHDLPPERRRTSAVEIDMAGAQEFIRHSVELAYGPEPTAVGDLPAEVFLTVTGTST